MTTTKPQPPLLSGSYPLIGHLIEMAKDQPALLRRGQQEKGAPYMIKMGKTPCVVLQGPEHAKVFFQQTDKALRMDKAYQFLKAIFGNTSFLQSPESYHNQRPVQIAPFKRDKMLSYIPIIQEEVQRWLDGLGEEGEIQLVDEMRYLTQVVAAHAMMGKEFRNAMSQEFWDLFMDISNALDPYLPSNWPFPKFIRRDRAKKRMIEILEPIIKERQAHPEKYDDFLQELLMTKTKDGEQLTVHQAIDWVIGFMFAGHETTYGHGSWLMILLLQNPWYIEHIEKEMDELMPYGTQISIEHIVGLKHIQWAIDETERMKPVAPGLFRGVEEPLELDGYSIPAGSWVMLDTLGAHYSEKVYTEPEKFDPLRFGPERDEGKGRFKLTGFGGGIHTCTGKNFAHYEMKIIASLMLQQFTWELRTKDPHTVMGKGAAGPSQTTLAYKRKTLTKRAAPQATPAATGCPHMAAAQNA